MADAAGESMLITSIREVGYVLLTVAIVVIIYQVYISFVKSPDLLYILAGTKPGNIKVTVPQDPTASGAINLPRSNEENEGIEFSYAFWIAVNDYSATTSVVAQYTGNTNGMGSYKHILHKGNNSSDPLLRAPGIWLHPETNVMRIYMNTFADPFEYIDIDNLPISKWYHVAVSVKGRTVNVFINGILKKSHILGGIPRQNFEPLIINQNGGFSGMISNVVYASYSLNMADLLRLVEEGPSNKMLLGEMSKPPYLSHSWFFN